MTCMDESGSNSNLIFARYAGFLLSRSHLCKYIRLLTRQCDSLIVHAWLSHACHMHMYII